MSIQLQERLKQGDLIIMDGGTGTEMEKRGAPMIEKGWCASSTLTDPTGAETLFSTSH